MSPRAIHDLMQTVLQFSHCVNEQKDPSALAGPCLVADPQGRGKQTGLIQLHHIDDRLILTVSEHFFHPACVCVCLCVCPVGGDDQCYTVGPCWLCVLHIVVCVC